MSLISALAIHNAVQKHVTDSDDYMSTEPAFTFSQADRENFISHMSAGVKLMIKPTEDAIVSKTQEILDNQGLLEKVIDQESERFQSAQAAVDEIDRVVFKIPLYRQKLAQIKREMASIRRRSTKLAQKAEQLRVARVKIVEKEQQQAAKLAKLEARVVATTPNTAANTGGKVAVVKEQ